MKEILRQVIPEAVVATDDFLAFGSLQALQEQELSQVPVYGFNNSIRARYQRPSLASVDIHPEELGYHAARLLIESIQNPQLEAKHQIVATSLIHRETG
jgi:DNA-binding LacI/PurR family transcriptional regulator